VFQLNWGRDSAPYRSEVGWGVCFLFGVYGLVIAGAVGIVLALLARSLVVRILEGLKYGVVAMAVAMLGMLALIVGLFIPWVECPEFSIAPFDPRIPSLGFSYMTSLFDGLGYMHWVGVILAAATFVVSFAVPRRWANPVALGGIALSFAFIAGSIQRALQNSTLYLDHSGDVCKMGIGAYWSIIGVCVLGLGVGLNQWGENGEMGAVEKPCLQSAPGIPVENEDEIRIVEEGGKVSD
jgi:hypothetical protein